MSNVNMNDIVGRYDIVFITLDTLRFDAAQHLFNTGQLPTLTRYLPATGWELRHSPASFTYAAHQAFFAGFLPTPATTARHTRAFALAFAGSETITNNTCVLGNNNIVAGLAERGYHTICIGGVGFFNKQTPLGSVLPGLFTESHWQPAFGVTDPQSTYHQIQQAQQSLAACAGHAFLFINISAIHQPNKCYLPHCTDDNLDSHQAALAYVDRQLAPLFATLSERGGAWVIICSDHGTCYGDDGFHGHRLAHPAVWNVPYSEFLVTGQS